MIADAVEILALPIACTDPGSATEEMVRWVTPTRHELRTARKDFVVRGGRPAAAESPMMSYLLANRDEDVCEDQCTLGNGRNPNNHVGFDHRAHPCPGAAICLPAYPR